MGCGCTDGIQAKGLKVVPDFTSSGSLNSPPLNLNATRVHGSKMIRLKRRNLCARYKAMITLKLQDSFIRRRPQKGTNKSMRCKIRVTAQLI